MSTISRPGQSNPDTTFSLRDIATDRGNDDKEDSKVGGKGQEKTKSAGETEKDAAAAGLRQSGAVAPVTGGGDVFEVSKTGDQKEGGISGIGSHGKSPILFDSTAASKSTHENASVAATIMNDVRDNFGNFDGDINAQFEKLKKECKNDIQALNDKIKELGDKADKLEEMAKKLQKIADKMETLIPELLQHVGEDPGTRNMCQGEYKNDFGSQADKAVFDILQRELKAAGIPIDATKLEDIANAITKGGQGAMALAMVVLFAVVEISVTDAAKASNKKPETDGADQQAAQEQAQDPAKLNKPAPADLPKTDAAKDTSAVDEAKQLDHTDPTVQARETNPPAAADDTKNTKGEDPQGDELRLQASSVANDASALRSDQAQDVPDEIKTDAAQNDPAADFAAKLDNLAKYAATYAESDPYQMQFVQQADGSFAFQNSFDEANAALIMGAFPGLGTSPNNVQLNDSAENQQIIAPQSVGEGKGAFQVEGFSMSNTELKVLTMMPPQFVAAYVGKMVGDWAATQIKRLTDEAKKIREVEIPQMKDQIKALENQIVQLDKKKAEVIKQQNQAKKNIEQMKDRMQQRELEMQTKMLEIVNSLLVMSLDSTSTSIMNDSAKLGFDRGGARA